MGLCSTGPPQSAAPHRLRNDLAVLCRIVEARLWGLRYVVRHAAPRTAQGSITVTSGSLSSRPRPETAMLTDMWSAVEALAPALALELAPVYINVVTPGLIDTPLHTAYGAERDTIVKSRAAVLPGRRVGTGDEVAQVILMLKSNACIWMGWPLRVIRLDQFSIPLRIVHAWPWGGAWAHARESARRS